MSEYSEMLAHSVGGLFANFADSANLEAMWQSSEDLGIANLLMPADEGGMDGSWQDAELVWRLAGLHAVPLPIGETMIARYLLRNTGLSLTGRPIILSTGVGELTEDGHFSGTARALSPVLEGALLLIGLSDKPGGPCILVSLSDASSPSGNSNMAGEPRPTFTFDDVKCERIEGLDFESVFNTSAVLRASQIGGALSACLDLCQRYASERSQFGRELKRFQAIQHQIALLAEEAAAVTSAAASAAYAMDSGDFTFAAACAKLRANQACGASALIAHQVHGAIGITEEYALQRFTRRLWAWRSEFGNDRFWAERIGDIMLARQSGSPWSQISGTMDI